MLPQAAVLHARLAKASIPRPVTLHCSCARKYIQAGLEDGDNLYVKLDELMLVLTRGGGKDSAHGSLLGYAGVMAARRSALEREGQIREITGSLWSVLLSDTGVRYELAKGICGIWLHY